MKSDISNFRKWAEAHVFYETYTHTPHDRNNRITVEESRWRKQVIKEAEHGKLLIQNSFLHKFRNI